ncbi:Structural maintenance of chromosomes protein 4 [Platysternon megacephalum]|uniref:Structural maintenance of chromosomes protein 4 n=1 Tax=Platysternon megacephalum TaxID=55544 RepID=A0A4D9DHS1_9SAUR|nr:Structural maintenance of chromosomes protein 4 [Platysternon megacephalum]
MPSKRTKTCTAARQKGKEPLEESTSDMEVEKEADTCISEASQQAASDGVLDNRSLEEILSSISPPPPPAMTNEAGAPRLMITHIVNQNFKSYAGEQILGPFHKEGDDYEVIPNSNFCVSRTAYRDNSSVYHISGKKKTFKDVGILLRSHGIDLDHNRFLILQCMKCLNEAAGYKFVRINIPHPNLSTALDTPREMYHYRLCL